MTTREMTMTRSKAQLSMPALLLRVEGLALLAAAVTLYFAQGFGWVRFVVLLFSPDLVFVIYAVNKRAGVMAYNIVHALILPLALGVIALLTGWTLCVSLALIWLAHIGMDRLVGYGLKYLTDFNDTHLGRV